MGVSAPAIHQGDQGVDVPQKTSHFPDVQRVVETLSPGYPVYCLRPEELKRCAQLFLDSFPGRVLYAIKCNPHPAVLDALYDAGVRHFDTASLNEIATIRERFHDADCYFMHPVKARASILSAREVYHVDHWVVDHDRELDKIVEVTDGGDGQVILVRLRTKPFGAAFELSDKFGILPEDAPALLERVSREGFQAGLAFHVGSQCRNPEAFRDAIRAVGRVLDETDVKIHYLDVGGGFPAHYIDDQPPPFAEFVAAITEELSKIKLRKDCVLMCEPGRSLVASATSLLTQVQLRKDKALYINDGIYHSLNETLTAGIKLPVRPIRKAGGFSGNDALFKVYGPTCDSTDVLPYELGLPDDIDEGDWIEFGQIGAYSNAMTTRFNGFFPETYVTVDEPPLAPALSPVAA